MHTKEAQINVYYDLPKYLKIFLKGASGCVLFIYMWVYNLFAKSKKYMWYNFVIGGPLNVTFSPPLS